MRKVTALAAAVLVTAAVHAPAGAQERHDAEIRRTEASLDSIEQRILDLSRQIVAQQLAESAADSARESVDLDTAAVGPFLVVGRSSHVRRTHSYFEHAWEMLEPHFTGLDPAVRGHVFLTNQGGQIAPNLWRMTALPGHELATFPLTPDPVIGRNAAEMALGRLLLPHLPLSIRTWLGGGGVGMRNEANRVIRYITLPPTAAAAERGRRCLDGDAAACRAILSLPDGGPTRGDPVRTSFFHYVLDHAEPGGVAAASSDTGSAGAEIEKLGGAPLDTLLLGWVETLKDARSQEAGTAGHRVLSTLAWIAIFGALATRSTRWRLG